MGNGGNYWEHMFIPPYCSLIIVQLNNGSGYLCLSVFLMLCEMHVKAMCGNFQAGIPLCEHFLLSLSTLTPEILQERGSDF